MLFLTFHSFFSPIRMLQESNIYQTKLTPSEAAALVVLIKDLNSVLHSAGWLAQGIYPSHSSLLG